MRRPTGWRSRPSAAFFAQLAKEERAHLVRECLDLLVAELLGRDLVEHPDRDPMATLEKEAPLGKRDSDR